MFKDRKFSGEDPILIFELLKRIFQDAETLKISDGQLMVFLPHLLTGIDGDKCLATDNGSRSGNVGGIVNWPEAVHNLMRGPTHC